MNNYEAIKNKLLEDSDNIAFWVSDEYRFGACYDCAPVSGMQITMVLEDVEEVLVIVILPAVEPDHYDAWMRFAGPNDMIYLHHGHASSLEQFKADFIENLPLYLETE